MNRALLRLALPNILSNISIPLLSSVDTALMGHLSAAHLGAVGLGGMIFNFLYWNFGFLRMGTTGMTAQAVGGEDLTEQARILAMACSLALLLAMLLLLSQNLLLHASTHLLNAPQGQLHLIVEYFSVRIWAAPATLLLYVVVGWLFGQQNAWLPLLITTVANVVNIAASYYLVNHLLLQTAGVAWGTVLAQYVALAVGLAAIAYYYPSRVKLLRLDMVTVLQRYRRLLRINGDIFLRTLSLTFAFAFFYSRSAAAGAIALATTTVLLQFLNWMSYAIDGFAYAAEALVGKAVGAKQATKLRTAIRLSFVYGAVCALGFSLLYWLLGEQLVAVFTSDLEVQNSASTLLPFLIALPLVGSACYIWDGVFVGLTATKAMRDTMALALIAYFGTYYLLAPMLDDVLVLWLALLVFLGSRGVLQSLWYWRKGILLR